MTESKHPWRNTYKSYCIHKIRTTGSSSAQRGGKTYSKRECMVRIRVGSVLIDK